MPSGRRRRGHVLDDRRVTYDELRKTGRQRLHVRSLRWCRQRRSRGNAGDTAPRLLDDIPATASIGAIWVGLNPRYQLEEYRYVVGDCEPVLLLARTRIGERDFAADIAALRTESTTLHKVVVLGGDPPLEDSVSMAAFLAAGQMVTTRTSRVFVANVASSDPALIVYTSGSTGRPKGALLPHRGLCGAAATRCATGGRTRASAEFLPINHIGCVGDVSSWTLVAGGCIVFLEKFDPARSMELTAGERCTVWGGIPTTIIMCMALPDFGRFNLSSLQLIFGAVRRRRLISCADCGKWFRCCLTRTADRDGWLGDLRWPCDDVEC
jgi:acyl-CoA synthetase (AMP-forming)/AMP-acid ligase II